MTTPGSNERPYEAQPVDSVETESERTAREQQEAQAAAGETTESRNAGPMSAQNTPGPETQR